ncbi:MAG: TetR family transcriptional regulator, partial [Thermoanaerobaculia bacterium]
MPRAISLPSGAFATDTRMLAASMLLHTSSMTRTVKAEETRERILDAALRLFREHGFDETTMRDIASEAGV